MAFEVRGWGCSDFDSYLFVIIIISIHLLVLLFSLPYPSSQLILISSCNHLDIYYYFILINKSDLIDITIFRIFLNKKSKFKLPVNIFVSSYFNCFFISSYTDLAVLRYRGKRCQMIYERVKIFNKILVYICRKN